MLQELINSLKPPKSLKALSHNKFSTHLQPAASAMLAQARAGGRPRSGSSPSGWELAWKAVKMPYWRSLNGFFFLRVIAYWAAHLNGPLEHRKGSLFACLSLANKLSWSRCGRTGPLSAKPLRAQSCVALESALPHPHPIHPSQGHQITARQRQPHVNPPMRLFGGLYHSTPARLS